MEDMPPWCWACLRDGEGDRGAVWGEKLPMVGSDIAGDTEAVGCTHHRHQRAPCEQRTNEQDGGDRLVCLVYLPVPFVGCNPCILRRLGGSS